MRETNDTQHTFRMSRGGGRTKSRAESAEHAEKASELISRRERRARREETLRTHLAQRAQSTQKINNPPWVAAELSSTDVGLLPRAERRRRTRDYSPFISCHQWHPRT